MALGVSNLLILVVLFLQCPPARLDFNGTFDSTHRNRSVLRNLAVAYLNFFDDVFTGLKIVENVTEVCRRETDHLDRLARDGHVDALRILDSSGKPPSGILDGDMHFLGSYHECMDTVVDLETNLRGQYCMVEFFLTEKDEKDAPLAIREVLPYQLRPPTVALCLPRSCSTQDVQAAVQLSSNANFGGVYTHILYCDANVSTFSTDVGALITLSFLVLLVLLATTATVLDYRLVHRRVEVKDKTICFEHMNTLKSSKCLRCLLALSFYSNGMRLFSVKKVGLTSLHGLKVISVAQVIFSHVLLYSEYFTFFRNPKDFEKDNRRFATQILYAYTYDVDTFYCISGILVMYVGLKTLQNSGGRMNILQYYFHRYMRLTPVMMAIIVFGIFLYPYTASGPTWESVKPQFVDNCKANWWTNLLHVQNFVNVAAPCHKIAWYVATDMQMFLITPLILIPCYKGFKYGVASLLFFMAFAAVTPAVIAVVYHIHAYHYFAFTSPSYKQGLQSMNFQGPLSEDSQELDTSLVDYANIYYKKSYCRMSPYIVGMAFGYFLLRTKTLVLSKRTVAGLWSGYVVLTLFLMYVPWPERVGHVVTVAETVAYMALGRALWAVCIGWIVVACTYGYGGLINTFLSCSVMEVMSKLTYCVYLLHPMVLLVLFASRTSTEEFGMQYLVLSTLGVFFITLFLSLPLSMLFELPVLTLEKEILSQEKK